MNQTKLLNTVWMHSYRGEARRFRWSLRHVEAAQFKLLQQTLFANRDSQYGERHHFRRIENYRDFCRHIPLVSYEDLAAEMQRIAAGKTNVLTAEPVRLLEPTSGTSSAEKLIPYTRGLQKQFQRGLAAWIADLYSHRPAVRAGRAYWSISPAMDQRRISDGGISIGFEDDTQYLGFVQRHFAGRILAVPPSVAQSATVEQFQYQTLLHLLATKDLALVSVWSPTFLTTLLAKLDFWRDRFLDDLRHHHEMPQRRAAEVNAILQSEDELSTKCRALWPRLAVVSCWADATASLFVPQLSALLPQAELQPKGLLATEAFVSLPLIAQPGSALALRSHFFEFEDITSSDADPHRPLTLAHDLLLGHRYRVVVTTMGGLYRYQLGDNVEVVGFVHECPLIRFIGRGNQTCDLVGEKLHESHVRGVIERILAKHSIAATFAMLAPDVESPSGYHLFLECDDLQRADALTSQLAEDMESGLRENPYYAHAVEIGQLSPVNVCLISGPEPAAEIYQRERVKRGQRLGNIKPTAIDAWTGWKQAFAIEPSTSLAEVAGIGHSRRSQLSR